MRPSHVAKVPNGDTLLPSEVLLHQPYSIVFPVDIRIWARKTNLGSIEVTITSITERALRHLSAE